MHTKYKKERVALSKKKKERVVLVFFSLIFLCPNAFAVFFLLLLFKVIGQIMLLLLV